MTEEMTIYECAAKLGVSHMTIRNYVKKGLLRAKKYRKGLRTVYKIDSADLDEFLENYY